MSRARTSVAATMAALLVSCSLVLGIEDRRVGASDAGLAPNVPLGEGGTVPNPLSPEGGVDPDAAALDAGPRFCANSAHKECLDFEDGVLTGPTLERATVIVDGPGSSSASALHAVAESEQAGRAFVRIPFVANVRSIRWTFDVLLDQFPNNMEFNELVLPSGNAECRLRPAVENSRLTIFESCPNSAQVVHDLGPLRTGVGWYSLAFAVDFGGPFGPKTLAVGIKRPGEDATSSNISLGTGFGTSLKAELRVGLTFTEPAKPGANLRVDNLTLDYE